MAIRLIAMAAVLALGLTACSSVTPATVTASTLWDSTVLHDISLDVDDTEYDDAIAAYLADGTKNWISATLTIDANVFENVGIKLKGNSTLKIVASDSEAETLPWLIRLDKYVDGQSYDGTTELVVRGNTTETALNEAVALELLEAAGLASEQAISTRFSVNGGDGALRLVIENPDDEWVADEFAAGDLLYKAEAGGDYSYLGDDADAYADVFDQDAGDDDLVPLTTFLKFLNESDDTEFASDLSSYLDVDSFATYLAFQQVVDNYDDIDGPGNNSYLEYSASTGLMTVVNWDLNLSFGARNNVGGRGGGQRPAGGGGGGGGTHGGSNVLSERFLANDAFAALVDDQVATLTASLFTSGVASDALDAWTALLTDQASDLASTDTIVTESKALATKIDAVG